VGDVPAPTATYVVAAGTELTLRQCITRALEKNFDLEIGRFNPQIAQDSIKLAEGGYDPVFTVSGTHGGTTTGATDLTNEFSTTSSDLRAGVTQQFYTGTTVSATTKFDRGTTDPVVSGLNPAYNSNLTLAVRQSLLSGFGSEVNKANLNRARIGFDIANLNFKAQVLSVIQGTENAYFLLVYAREQLVVRNFSLALANRLQDEAQTRRDTGVATDLDVLQAQVGVANARRNVLLAEQTVQDRQDALLAIIGQFELDSALGVVNFLEISDATPLFASSYQMAKQNQPEYLASIATIEQLKLDLKVAKDATKPDLSVGAAVGLGGRTDEFDRAFANALDQQDQSWQVDFAFSYPWGQASDKARYRQSLSTLSREQIRLRQLEQTIEVQVRTAVRSVETNLESVKIATLASDLSRKQYELEKARFDAGLSTSRRVLEAQDDLESNRVNELQAKATLHAAISALHRIEGSSLQRYGITLP
jgi:outer membrane protein